MARAGMSRAERLAAYLAEAARTPFDYGDFDCGVGFAARWIERERGTDPALRLRGTYRTALGAARLIRAAGGLPVLVGREVGAAGLLVTDDPQTGDVAVVWLQGARRRVQALSIRTPRRWAFLAPNGVGVGPAVLIQAWGV